MEKYIYLQNHSGLGDRLLALAAAIWYGRKHDRRVVVDWSDGLYAAAGTNAFPLLFDPDPMLVTEPPRPPESVYPPQWKRYLNQPFGRFVEGVMGGKFCQATHETENQIDLRQAYDDEAVVLCAASQLLSTSRGPLSSSHEIKQLYQEIYASHLRPQNDIIKRVNQYCVHHNIQDSLGIHVRLTKEGASRRVPLKYLSTVVSEFVRKWPKNNVYVATDNIDALKYFQDRFARIIHLEKWFPPAGEAIHYSTKTHDLLHDAYAALTEMLILSRCQFIAYPVLSAFSRVATLMASPHPHQISIPLTGYPNSRFRLIQIIRKSHSLFKLRMEVKRAYNINS